MTEPVRHADIVILGAGPVGMALAQALRGSRHTVLLLDPKPRGAWASDPRALAIAHGSRQLLERLDAWPAGDATAIRDIHVSQQGGFGRTLLEAGDYDIPALGYVMRYRNLAARLDLGLDAESLLSPATLESLTPGEDAVQLRVSHRGETLRIAARLVVHAEGTPGDSPAYWKHDYRQQAVIAEVQPAKPHGHRAWERFTADGPLALLPLEQVFSVVLTAPSAVAQKLLHADDETFLAALRQRFSGRLDFVASGPRAAFPLALRLRKNCVDARQVWIGNTAQTLHPVTGQGFNLGLRDAWSLAEALWENPSPDPGTPGALAAYQRKRQPDRLVGTLLTDGLVRLFSNAFTPLQHLRGAGLLAFDLIPPLRHPIARQMIWGRR